MGFLTFSFDDLENAAFTHVRVERRFGPYGLLDRGVPNSEGVVDLRVIDRHWMRLFHYERIPVPVNRRVDPQREKMLVVRCHDPGGHQSSIRNAVSQVDRGCGQDSCRSNLIVDGCILRELERKDVSVIAHCDDRLENENTGPCYYCVVGAIVGVASTGCHRRSRGSISHSAT